MEIIGDGHLAQTIKQSFRDLKLQGDYTIIAIDTLINPDYSVDLFNIEQAIKQAKKNENLVIVMSPVPVGTCKRLQKILGRKLIYNPENLRIAEGTELYINADRQIIGCDDELVLKMTEFYEWFKNPIYFMSLKSAEMVKHGINSFLATSITFANQLAKKCEAVGADYGDVIKGIKSDSRIGQRAYLTPGEPSRHLKRDLKILNEL